MCIRDSLTCYSIFTSLQNFNSTPRSPLKTPRTVKYWLPLILENSTACSLLNQQATFETDWLSLSSSKTEPWSASGCGIAGGFNVYPRITISLPSYLFRTLAVDLSYASPNAPAETGFSGLNDPV